MFLNSSNNCKRTICRQVLLLLLGLALNTNQIKGQSFIQQFDDLLSKKDTAGQQKLLEKWSKSDSNDPELFVAYFNYFVSKGRKEIIMLGNDPNGKDALKLQDPNKSDQAPSAFLYDNGHYDPTLLSKGFEWIDKGIDKHPNRLDMRFGKIYIYGEIRDYENFTTEIIKTIDYSDKNKNKWTGQQ
jgi:hypothetical protein